MQKLCALVPRLINWCATLLLLAAVLLVPNIAEAQRIGSFDESRQSDASFGAGAFYDQARDAIRSVFPNVTFTVTPVITAEFLGAVDVFVFGSAKGCCSAITPLSQAEQGALADFVRLGGVLVMHVDNDAFDPIAVAVHASMLSPFGLSAGGTVFGTVQATVPSPALSPITSGPFGVVTAFSEVFPGAFTELGAATPLAFNPLGPSLAVLNPGDPIPVVGIIDGRVILLAEHSQFFDDDIGFGQFSIPAHRALLLNIFNLSLAPQQVSIDVKPRSFPNTINLGAAGVVPVAILSTATFHAGVEVDPSSLVFAGAGVKVVGKSAKSLCSTEDVNDDGIPDLLCHFNNELEAEAGDSVGVLEGHTFSGKAIRGQDSIRIVPN